MPWPRAERRGQHREYDPQASSPSSRSSWGDETDEITPQFTQRTFAPWQAGSWAKDQVLTVLCCSNRESDPAVVPGVLCVWAAGGAGAPLASATDSGFCSAPSPRIRQASVILMVFRALVQRFLWATAPAGKTGSLWWGAGSFEENERNSIWDGSTREQLEGICWCPWG